MSDFIRLMARRWHRDRVYFVARDLILGDGPEVRGAIALRIRNKIGGKLACRRDCLLHSLDGRRGAPGIRRVVSRSAMAWREASAPSNYCIVST